MSDDYPDAAPAASEPSQPSHDIPDQGRPDEIITIKGAPDADKNISAMQAGKLLASVRTEDEKAQPKAPPVEIRYTDGRDPSAEVSLEEAHKDLTTYRKETAARLMEELGEQSPAADGTTTPTEQPTIAEQYQTEQQTEQQQAEQREWQRQQAWQQQTEAATATYTQGLANIVASLQGQVAQDYSGLQTEADLELFKNVNPAGFQRLMQLRAGIINAQQELVKVHHAKQQENAQRQQQHAQAYNAWAAQQDSRIEQMIPELRSDAPEHRDFQRAALDTLRQTGFVDDELKSAWNGEGAIALRDARVQAIIADATRYRQIIAKAKTATAKPVPPVQRPGVARPRTADAHAQMQALTQQLENSGGNNALRIAARLVGARREARK